MTEKNYNPEQRQIKASERMEKVGSKKDKIAAKSQPNKEKINEDVSKIKNEEKKDLEIKNGETSSRLDQSKEEIKQEEKKEIKLKEKKTPKTEAIVNGVGLHISSKQSFAISKFIKYKEINFAIKELEEILLHRKPLPMKGEIPHRKGKIMSGRYPKNSIKEFIRLLKSLNANANVNEIMNPVISEVHANFASRPYGRFGRVRKKRTNVTIIAIEKKIGEKKKK